MNIANQCETLFHQVDDLGAGVAALGDLLQFGQKEAYPETLNGLAIVLRHLGASMRGINTQFLATPYWGIRELETKDDKAMVKEEGLQSPTVRAANDGSSAEDYEVTKRLKEILSDALPR